MNDDMLSLVRKLAAAGWINKSYQGSDKGEGFMDADWTEEGKGKLWLFKQLLSEIGPITSNGPLTFNEYRVLCYFMIHYFPNEKKPARGSGRKKRG